MWALWIKNMKNIILLILFLPFFSNAEENINQKVTLELCYKMQFCPSFDGIMDVHINQMKKYHKDISPEYWVKEKERLATKYVIVLYQEKFSQNEIKELIKIYDQPVMKDFERKRAEILTGTMGAMKQWRLNFDPNKVSP
jgi:uncharacterized protein YllA (UPF0747 family)